MFSHGSIFSERGFRKDFSRLFVSIHVISWGFIQIFQKVISRTFLEWETKLMQSSLKEISETIKNIKNGFKMVH